MKRIVLVLIALIFVLAPYCPAPAASAKGSDEAEVAYCRLENEPLAWGATLRQARQLRLGPKRKSLSEHPKN